MNLDLVAIFQSVATDLLLQFGRPVATGGGATIQAVIEQSAEPVGDYGERVESRWTATVAKASGVAVGDTLIAGSDTWKLTQLIADDGFVQKFAIRQVTV